MSLPISERASAAWQFPSGADSGGVCQFGSAPRNPGRPDRRDGSFDLPSRSRIARHHNRLRHVVLWHAIRI
jgi:hypothetical protein